MSGISEERKIIQIAFDVDVDSDSNDDNVVCSVSGSSTCFALCNDGTIWFVRYKKDGSKYWDMWDVPPIPQDNLVEEI